MSPEGRPRTLRAALHAEPRSARAADGLDGALERWAARRAEAARAQGLVEGERRALEGAAKALAASVESLDRAHEEAARSSARTSARLALEIARLLLRREIPAGGYDLEAIVRECLALSGTGRGRCVVHLNPADAERLGGVTFRAGTVVEPDPAVPRGCAQVSTPQGLLVRDFDDALRSIGERILGDLA